MSHYAKGIDVGGFNITKGFATPSRIQAYKDEVDGQISQLGRDLVKAWKADATDDDGNIKGPSRYDDLRNAYAKFINAWKVFYQNSSNLWGSTWDQTEHYQDQLKDWRQKIASTGISPTGPEPRKPDTGGISLASMFGWGLAIVGVAVVVPPIIRSFRD